MSPSFLPVDAVIPEVQAALRLHRAVVLQAPTGSGKTTRVSPALLASGALGDGLLLLLQPRRVAARACARMMAQQLGEPVGETVGYQIRFEQKRGPKTRILVVTEGILTRRFASDPMLEGVSCVVLDEFHERSLHTDLALAFLKELMSLRDDLKVVVMSATLDAAPVSAFFDCPSVTAEGRTFPLRINYEPTSPTDPLEERVEVGLKRLFADPADDGGHVLVFLPGAGEIRRTQTHLARRNWDAEIVPLHGGLSTREQDYALTPGQQRRIILATNIAETSLTIEGVTAVVDTGLHKMLSHDAGRGTDRLDRVRISAAGATQRAGRAGRTAPGRVIRLWSQEVQAIMPAADPPEIERADLTGLLLSVLDFHGPEPATFPFFQRPPEAALNRATRMLALLGATDGAGRINSLGQRLTAMPLHPRAGAILERAAKAGLVDEAATLCALLEERAPRDMVDLFACFEAYRGGDRLFEGPAARRISHAERQLQRRAARLWPKGSLSRTPLDGAMAARLMLAGYPDRLCRRRSQGQGVMVGGRGVSFQWRGRGEPDFFLALELVERGKDRTTAKVDRLLPVDLEDLHAVLDLQEEEGARFDEAREAVNGVRRLRYEDLLLWEKPSNKVSAGALAEELAARAATAFARIFQPDKEALQLLLRIRFAAKNLPEQAWPDVSEQGLCLLLPQLCTGHRKFEQLRRLDWRRAVWDRLDYKLRQLLDKEVPERLTVPSGSQVRIDYESALEDGGFPVLAVRLQEMFGMADTPRIARGRVPLLCHLLAPNMRPAQMTRDLRSFWNNTYAEVRKELRQRYPKHAWPEDPWTAKAIRGVLRRRK